MLNIDTDRQFIEIIDELTADDISQITNLPSYLVKGYGQLTEEIATQLSRVLTVTEEIFIQTFFSNGTMIVNNTPRSVQYLQPDQADLVISNEETV